MKSFFSLVGVELSEVSCREKAVSALGGLLTICLQMYVTEQALGLDHSAGIIASMGASAVLLFGVPHGQLSQPWPLLAGHGFSAIIGVLCARYLGHDWRAAGIAVAASILVMHQLKCIHPPGGATALSAVIGGDAVYALGFHFVWWPVLANALIMLGVAVIFNWPFPWRRYPVALARTRHRHDEKPHPLGRENAHDDIVKALREIDSFVDIAESDIVALARIIAREREARLIKQSRKLQV